MDRIFTDETFEKADYQETPLKKGEYDHCIFNHCDFSNSDFSTIVFVECTFNSCNLSLIKLNNTTFRDVKFMDSKMLGIHFENCNKFGLSITVENCSLNHSSFYRTHLKKTVFKKAHLEEVDFTECDLTASIFDNCNFTGAKFDHTILEKVDFRTSFNYSLDPEINRIKKAKFSGLGLAGLLDKYDIEIE